MYESDITKFMRELMHADPSLAVEQKQNRATWWDKTQDSQTTADHAQSEAPKAPYAYFPLPQAVPTKLVGNEAEDGKNQG